MGQSKEEQPIIPLCGECPHVTPLDKDKGTGTCTGSPSKSGLDIINLDYTPVDNCILNGLCRTGGFIQTGNLKCWEEE